MHSSFDDALLNIAMSFGQGFGGPGELTAKKPVKRGSTGEGAAQVGSSRLFWPK